MRIGTFKGNIEPYYVRIIIATLIAVILGIILEWL